MSMEGLATIDMLGRWSSNSSKGERTASILLNGKLLIECGPHTVEAMLDQNLDPLKVDTVAITHMHLDHYVGLAEFLWYRAIYSPGLEVSVLGPKGIGNNTRELLKNVMTPEPFDINVKFREDRGFENILPFRANHVVDDNGYRVEYSHYTLFYSGDTAYSPNVVKGAEGADLLFHEMTYTDDKKDQAEFWKHSTYSDANAVFKESGAKKLVPVHLSKSSLELAVDLSRKSGNILLAEEGRFTPR